jgi:hypothetical protein
MKKRTIFLIALVIFFPLNSLPTFASDAANNTIANLPVSFGQTVNSGESVVKEYVDCFSVVSEDAMKYALSGYAELITKAKFLKKILLPL